MKKNIFFILCIFVFVVIAICDGKRAYAKTELPEIFIKAVNPGYTIDGILNVGEMIEIGRNTSDDMTSLAGLKIGYTNSSGNTVFLAEFSKYIWMAGETILLRLASSPKSELAHEQYTKTLALKAGPLTLIKDDEIIDSVCWNGKDECSVAFDSKNPTTLVRNFESGDFEHLSDYEPEFVLENMYTEPHDVDSHDDGLKEPSKCKNLEFSEILSYYESLQREQFIEFHNNSTENVNLDGCFVRYKNKNYTLKGMIAADGYFVRYLEDFKLTKNPTNSNILELVDENGAVFDKLEYPNGQKKGASYALIGYDKDGEKIWKVTYAITPGEPNNYQEFKTCEEGKVINEVTGNCVKVTSISEKICGEGQYLNILTGRCKKIPEDAGEKKCKDGYYLNEETGRCKKIVENNSTEYALVPETYEEGSSFVALYLVLGVLGIGVAYIVYEFRYEIMKILKRIIRR